MQDLTQAEDWISILLQTQPDAWLADSEVRAAVKPR